MEFNHCYGCMGLLPVSGARCPRCGYDNTKDPARQPPHALPCGTVLNGKYVVGRVLGQGGFGITYIGYDLNLELALCIKEYFPEGAAMRSASQSQEVFWGSTERAGQMRDTRQSLLKEARRAVKLRDLDHVVRVWDAFYENETSYIIMDYLKGETLKNRLLRTQRSLEEGECLRLLAPLMRDLEQAHQRGIIHRDIKPDNIMLTDKGETVLLDMGAAKDLGRSSGSGTAPSSALVVSQGFSPPEQYREQGGIGPWTDVYALCATMYYCITGRLLPPAIERMYEDKADFGGFSPAFGRALQQGLSLKAESRTQSVGELLRALEAAVGAASSRPDPNPGPKPTPPTPPRPIPGTHSAGRTKPRNSALLPALLGTAAVLVVALMILSGKAIDKKKASAPRTTSAPVVTAAPTAAPTPTPAPANSGTLGGGKTKDAPIATAVPSFTGAPVSPLALPEGAPLSTGTSAEGLSYELYDSCVRLTGYEGVVSSLTIPLAIEGKPVTVIGESAFANHSELKSISLPNTLLRVEANAFDCCSGLESLVLPDRLEYIGHHAFFDCWTITSLTIPDSVTTMDNSAFAFCKALRSVTLPQHLSKLDLCMFQGCHNLTEITIPQGVTEIVAYAFSGCSSLRSIYLPDSVTTIGASAFKETALQEIHFAGTRQQWSAVDLNEENFPKNVTVYCDG